jgi:hypothetical protein
MKILIEVEQGMVQNVHTSGKAEIVIVDWDTTGGFEDSSDIDVDIIKPDSINENMWELFTGTDNDYEAVINSKLKKLKF